MKGVLFHLRHNDAMERLIGSDIHIDAEQAFKGKVNHYKGFADVKFWVTGSKGNAEVVYRGKRTQPDLWMAEVFELDLAV
ncbi:hypothetical protein BC829DRAFT_400876 [Chytridium lagenaria]|nr:hypothetical protein BC829DRAFT_400876 [Chytridium lagenaria]